MFEPTNIHSDKHIGRQRCILKCIYSQSLIKSTSGIHDITVILNEAKYRTNRKLKNLESKKISIYVLAIPESDAEEYSLSF